jgi:predicted Abi (CAAX) family protease
MDNSSGPVAANDYYKPVGVWSGRLIFNREDRLDNGAVLIEIHNAPAEYATMINTEVELAWAMESNKELKAYVDFLTTDITFSEEANKSRQTGRVHPTRLDGLKAVGPLESLAGARPANSIQVVFEPGSVSVADGKLWIDKPPVQIRGKMRCLAVFLGADPAEEDQYVIQHYQAETGKFDGERETVVVPSFPVNSRGLRVSTAREVEGSPVNDTGWYLYGFVNETGMFTVEAWEPRRALMVGNLNQIVCGVENGEKALRDMVWKGTRYKKGVIETMLLDPTTTDKKDEATMIADWKVGDRFLVIHLFGGIGGDIVNEESCVGLIPGHFAFGDATIVIDDFTNELQFRIIHRQIYAHNNGGIVSGPNMWSSYCGDLERGWFGTRPISDIIVKLDIISTTYKLGDNHPVCPLDEVVREINEMGARYRSGDGDGSALVSTAHSCVQDSNQALFSALNETYRKLKNEEVSQWMQSNPENPQVVALKKLEPLYADIDEYLTPFGVRKDWSETAKGLRGTEKQNAVLSLLETIRTWRTVVPRRAHDRLANIFLKHGAKLWFIRANQIGGFDPRIIPLAPAQAFDFHDNQKDPAREGASKPRGIFCCV